MWAHTKLNSLIPCQVNLRNYFASEADAEKVCAASENSTAETGTLTNLFLSCCCIYFIECGEDYHIVLGQVCVPWSRRFTL